MSITYGDNLKHNNPLFPIVDIEDVKGGIRTIATFSNTDLYNEFNSIPDKLRQNYTSLIVTSTNQHYYLTGTDATITTSWTLTGSGLSASGTTNSIVKWTGSTSLGDSLITDSGDTVTINGNLNVIGTSSTITSENLLVKDPIILLAGSQSTPLFDSGLFVNRGTGDTQAFIWDESSSEFSFFSTTSSATTSGNVLIGTYSNVRTGPLSVGTGITSSSRFSVSSTGGTLSLVVNEQGDAIFRGDTKIIGATLSTNSSIPAGSILFGTKTSIYSPGDRQIIIGTDRSSTYNYASGWKFTDYQITNLWGNAIEMQNTMGTIRDLFVGANIAFIGYGIRQQSTLFVKGTTASIMRVVGTGATWSNSESIFEITDNGVGIGTNSPSTKLHVYATQSGAFRLQDGSEQNDYILKSDSNGVASWVSLSTIGISGASGSVPKFTGTSSLGDSRFTDNGTTGFYGSTTDYVSFISGGNTYLSLVRAQASLSFYLGNPQISQNCRIISTNTLGLTIESAGYTQFKVGVSYSTSLTIDSNGVYNQIKGTSNTIYGYQALFTATASSLNNTAFGYQALYASTVNESVAFGYQALRFNTTGIYNTALGNYSLYNNTTGGKNIAVGLTSLYKNKTGYDNTAVGHQSMYSNTTGYQNTAIGSSSLLNNTTVVNTINIINGGSGYTASSTFSNVQLSYLSGSSATTYPSVTVYVGVGGTVSNVILETYGTGFIDSTTIMSGNLGTGVTFSVGISSLTSGDNNTAVGYNSLYSNVRGVQNTAIGSGTLYANNANFNIAIGHNSLYNNTTGYYNLAIGVSSLQNNKIGLYNIAIGNSALLTSTQSYFNTAIGSSALQVTTSGQQNVGVGHSTLSANTTGGYNNTLGAFTLQQNTTGVNNIAIGSSSLNINTTGSNNIGIGSQAGSFDISSNGVTSSNTSIFIGSDTKPNSINQSNQIIIGHGATGSGSNSVTLGASTITKTQLRGTINIGNVPQYASNGAAISGGLVPGDIYQTLSNVLMVVI